LNPARAFPEVLLRGKRAQYNKHWIEDSSQLAARIFNSEFDPDKESFDNFMAAYDYFETLFKDKKIEVITQQPESVHRSFHPK